MSLVLVILPALAVLVVVFATSEGESDSPAPASNRLAEETSPYLLQHAHNPVDWYPWGSEALRLARREDKPIFLSVGYSSCHWCHVMERESFEDPETARLLNEHFVAIKVDREERPDLDQLYMLATEILTGRGGWPNSVFLTPDLKPWFAGTYFPPNDLPGRPGFKTVLRQLRTYWTDRREEVDQAAEEIARNIRGASELPARPDGQAAPTLTAEPVELSVKALRSAFDDEFGGFGSAPKFPQPVSLNLLLHRARSEKDPVLWEMVSRTLDAMACGGIHDHVGGGFHRYATDGAWHVPHFEKMLYDNAQLAELYASAAAELDEPRYARVARDICDFAIREMVLPDGAFASSIDADTPEGEGAYYAWSRDEIISALGRQRAERFCQAFDVRAEGNWRDEASGRATRTNLLRLRKPLDQLAETWGLSPEQARDVVDEDLLTLRMARSTRPAPTRDDKVLVAWNGLMIAALARCGLTLREPEYVEAASRAAEFLLASCLTHKGLVRSWTAGRCGHPAFLQDHACLIRALAWLFKASGRQIWLNHARRLAEDMIGLFADPQGGFYSARVQDDLLTRSRDTIDTALPSGNASAVIALVELADTAQLRQYLWHARTTLEAVLPAMRRHPQATAGLALGLARFREVQKTMARLRHSDIRRLPDVMGSSPPLEWEIYCSSIRCRPGGRIDLAVHLVISEPWQVYANQPQADHVMPTGIAMEVPNDLQTLWCWPEGNPSPYGNGDARPRVYSGATWVTGAIQIPPDQSPGPLELVFSLTCQPCEQDRCLEPMSQELTLTLDIDPQAPPATARHAQAFQLARAATENARA